MHRKVNKAFGIILLILAIICGIVFGVTFFLLNFKDLIVSFLTTVIKIPEEQANSFYNQYAGLLLNFKVDWQLLIIATLCFVSALLLLCSAKKINFEKQQKLINPFNVPKETYRIHYKATPLIIIGYAGYLISLILVYCSIANLLTSLPMKEIVFFTSLISGLILFISAFLITPISLNKAIRCRRVGERYEIRAPKNSLLTCKFMPYQICTQLQKAYNLGFDKVEYWEGFKGKIHIILSSSKCSLEQLENIERSVKKNKNLPSFYSLDCLYYFKVEKDTTGMHTAQYHSIDRYLVTKRSEEPVYLNVDDNNTFNKTMKKERFIFHFFGPNNKRLVDHDGNWCIAFVSGNKFNLNEINPKQ